MVRQPTDVATALRVYLSALDKVLPDAGVYLTGSVALGDWQPGSGCHR
jgi:hypothetical protein